MATGHLRKRVSKKTGEVSWQVTVEGEKDPLTGERQRAYKTVRGTKKQAEAVKRKMIDEMENGGITKASTMKLGDWMLQWLALYLPNIEATTRAGYKDRIEKRIIPILGSIPLKSLNTAHIQGWVNGLKKEGLAPKTVKNAYLNLKAALDKAVVLKMLPYNPCVGVELPKLQKYRGDIYDKAEMENLLKVAEGTDMYLIAFLAVMVGFRRGELVALRWDDVDLKKGIIHVRHNMVIADGEKITKAPKSSAGVRDISIGPKVVSELRKARTEYLKNKLTHGRSFKDSGLVICKPDGTGYRPDSITQKWERFIQQNGLKPIRFHDLRHSCATAMIEAGVDPKTVQQRLGHADISVTMNIYAHSTKAVDRSAADKMDALMFAKASGGNVMNNTTY